MRQENVEKAGCISCAIGDDAGVMDRKSLLVWQFQMTWQLAQVHLPHVTDALCHWEPSPKTWTVRETSEGRWRPDWAETEPDPAPTVSVGWLSWQIVWWWSGAIAAIRGDVPRGPGDVDWPGSAAKVREQIEQLHSEWTALVETLQDHDLDRPLAYPWTEAQPLGQTLAWVNAELMKNVAEIGYIRHLHGLREAPERDRG